MEKNTQNQPKTIVLIDGSNFYHYLKKLGFKHQLSFNYTAFGLWLSKRLHQLPRITYYIGEIKYNPLEPASKKLYAGQLKLFAHLDSNHVSVSKGYMLKTKDGIYHEKGVDVQIALDIAIGAYENSYNTCYLVSSDTDLIPAIKKARDLGKKIVYVGFRGYESRAMRHNTQFNEIILTKENLSLFVK